MHTMSKALSVITSFVAYCLLLCAPSTAAALPNGAQDVYNIFTIGNGTKITGTDYDPYVKDGGAYLSWSSSDFLLSYDGGPVGNDSSGMGIMLEDDSFPPRGAWLTYSTGGTGLDTRLHWMKVSANTTTLGSFQLTDLTILGFGDTYLVNIIGTKVGGGTVQTGTVSYTTDWMSINPTHITLTNFAGVQITSYEIDFTAVDTGSGGRPASFNFSTFSLSTARGPLPTATTGAASSITAAGAILNGTVNANGGGSTTVTFDYGTSTGYGSSATAAQSPVTGSSNTAVSAAISGLTCNTLYHFRVKGLSGGGDTINGSDATFTTGVCNTAPSFVGATTTLTVNRNATATDIKGLLHVSDSDSSQTETWTQSVAPNYGGTLGFSGATAASGSADITPGGTITYTPANGYSGTETFTVQVSDGTASATRQITVTIVPPPTTTVSTAALSADTGVSGTDWITNTASQTISGALSASLATGEKVEVSYNGGSAWADATTFTVGSSAWSTTTTLSGSNTFEARVYNAAGSSTAYTHTYTLDTTLPSAPSVSGTTPTASLRPTWTWTPGGGGNGTYRCSLDSGGWFTPIGASFTPDVDLVEGNRELNVQERDDAGNWSLSGVWTIVIDRTGPALILSTLSDNAVTNSVVLNITGTAADGSGVQGVFVNGNPADLTTNGFNEAVLLSSGTNTVTIIAKDSLNNETTATRHITYDNAAANLTVTSLMDNSTARNSIIDVVGTMDAGTNIDVTLNGAAQTVLASGQTYTATVNLALGMNTVEIAATDLSSKTNTRKRTVVYDNLGATLSISKPVQDSFVVTNAPVINGTITDAPVDGTIEILASGQTYTPAVTSGTFEQALNLDTEQTYTIVVLAKDNGGNVVSQVQRNLIYQTLNLTATTALAFGDQLVGSISTAQTVTISNTTSAPLVLNGISLLGMNPGQFSQSNDCPGLLAAGASCTVSVTFKPTWSGALSSRLNVSIASPASSKSISLAGTGIEPVYSVTPAPLPFGDQLIKTVSPIQTLTVSNTGTAPLEIGSISLRGTNPGQFNQTNDCPGALAAGATCTISVTFKPATVGAKSALLNVNVAAPAKSKWQSLAGTGTAPVLTVAPVPLPFGDQLINSVSPIQTLTVSNTGTAPLEISSINLRGMNPGQFRQTNDCPGSLATGASCIVSVTFKPTTVGAKNALLNVNVAAPAKSMWLLLTGTGL